MPTILDERGVVVTPSAVTIRSESTLGLSKVDQQYPINGITSVRREQPFPRAVAFLAVLAALALFNGSFFFGSVLIALGVYLWLRRKHSVVVQTAGGEVQVLSSHDHAFVESITDAIREAVAFRS